MTFYKLSMILVFIFLLSSLHVSLGTAFKSQYTDIFVDSEIGNDANTGLSVNMPKKTINEAIKSLEGDGAIYVVPRDSFYEITNNTKIIIQKPLNVKIVGYGDRKSIISSNGDFIVSVAGNSSLTLENLEIRSTEYNENGAIINNGTLTIHNCLFKHVNRGYGAVIRSYNLLKVEKSIFTNIKSNTSSMDMCSGSKTNINDCIFDSNRNYVAPLSADKNSILTVENSKFKHNRDSLQIKGDLVNIISCVFNDNGALVDAVNLNVKSSNFTENRYENQVLINSGNLTIENSKFEKNKGYILLKCINSSVFNTNFTDNKFESSIMSSSGMDIGNCNFKGNNGKGIVQGNMINVTHSQFEENGVADTYGLFKGVICLKSGDMDNYLVMEGCVIKDNKIGNNSGAICAYDPGDRCTICAHYNYFVNNAPRDVFLQTGPVDADMTCNWWGSNDGSVNRIKGKIITDPYLTLELFSVSSIPTKDLDKIFFIKMNLFVDSNGFYHVKDAFKYPKFVFIDFAATHGGFRHLEEDSAASELTIAMIRRGMGCIAYAPNGGGLPAVVGDTVTIKAGDPYYMHLSQVDKPMIFIQIN